MTMKPAHLLPLAALVVLATAWWLRKDTVPSERPLVPPLAQEQPTASAPASAAVATPFAASSQPPSASTPAALSGRALPDVSRMQREIQMALSSDERGKAGKAAQHIRLCQSAERTAQWLRDGSAAQRLGADERRLREIAASNEQLLPGCQAVDAASRAQLVPLLRRSLAEGDKGAAALLVIALEPGFRAADEPTVVAALRRDAWSCDRSSLGQLGMLAERQPQLVTPNDVGVLRELRRGFAGVEPVSRQTGGDARRKEAMDRRMAAFAPPPGADPAEVARQAAEVRSRCKT